MINVSLVSSVSSTLKRQNSNTQIVTPEEAKQRKSTMLNIVDVALDQFVQNLRAGKVKLNSSLDLDRLIKLALILSGEADSIAGKPDNQSEDIDMSKVEEILNGDDPDVQAMFKKLYQGYNRINDID